MAHDLDSTVPVGIDPDRRDDPIDSDDVIVLRGEVLRLRDAVMGASARREILDDRVAELETIVEILAADRDRLAADVAHLRGNPVVRAALASTRPLRRRLGARDDR